MGTVCLPSGFSANDRWNVFELRSQIGHRFRRSAAAIRRGQQYGAGERRRGGPLRLLRHAWIPPVRERCTSSHASARAIWRRSTAWRRPIWRGKMLNEMSTGEARRVLIARALVAGPRALVLDEPAAGLDIVSRQRFLDLIERLARDGTTLVLVTHHVEEITPDRGQGRAAEKRTSGGRWDEARRADAGAFDGCLRRVSRRRRDRRTVLRAAYRRRPIRRSRYMNRLMKSR